MSVLEDEDELLAQFLESEVLSETSDQEVVKTENEDEVNEGPQHKRPRMEDETLVGEEVNSTRSTSSIQVQDPLPSRKIRIVSTSSSCDGCGINNGRENPRRIDTGIFSKVPPELYHHILKFLSSEDLVACSLVCRFLSFAASDEALWRRLYCMRWGLLQPTNKLRDCAWKKLYIQRDEEDMVEFVRNCPSEFKEYYIQMQTAKRSQAPLPSQVNDDRMILDKTVADQVSIWKSSKGLADKVVTDHACSGETCSYYQIGDVFVCEKTGNVHVCDDTCKEVILDPTNELLVCTISGHCFDRLLSPDDEMDQDTEQQQGGVSDEAEPFMGSGRFARAYLLGYNCADEKELEACLKFC